MVVRVCIKDVCFRRGLGLWSAAQPRWTCKWASCSACAICGIDLCGGDAVASEWSFVLGCVVVLWVFLALRSVDFHRAHVRPGSVWSDCSMCGVTVPWSDTIYVWRGSSKLCAEPEVRLRCEDDGGGGKNMSKLSFSIRGRYERQQTVDEEYTL